uniref:Uncharacterized protein n=1 Tax=Chaetoceros debilis TaxID=122233 RepID=A0A7S3QHB5_9STRA
MVKFNTAVITIVAIFAGTAHAHVQRPNSMSSHGTIMMKSASASTNKHGRSLRRADSTKQTKGIMKLADDEIEQFLTDFHSRGLHAHRHRHLQTAIGWKPLGNEIQADSNPEKDRAGSAVSMNLDGSRVAIAAYDRNNGQGQVRVFDLVDDVWNQIGRDLDGLGGDSHGNSVSLSNDGLRLAIGAPNHANYMGTTRVYTYDTDSDSWIGLGSDIDGLRSNDFQGAAVSLSGDGQLLAIGAPEGGGGNQLKGYARIFKYDDTQSRWRQFGNTLEGEYYQATVGSACALNEDGTRVAIAGKFHPNDIDNLMRLSGHVKTYQLDNSDPASPKWVPMGEGFFGDCYYQLLGDSVDINAVGDRIAIGASGNPFNTGGKAAVYQWLEEEWVQLGSDIFGLAIGEGFGTSISISADGGRIAVGSPKFDDLGDDKDFLDIGQARIFDYIFDDTSGKEDFDWVQVGRSITGECGNDNAARSLDMSKDGKRVVLGAPNNDYYNGHARVFEATEGFTGNTGSSCYTFPPTPSPSSKPTDIASAEPTGLPTSSPSVVPTKTPTLNPTGDPTTSPTSSPSAHPSSNPTAEKIIVESQLLFEISFQGACECSTETTATVINYLENAWQTPNVGFKVDSIQCEGVCVASRGPGDKLDFITDAVLSVEEGNEDLMGDPVSSVAAINMLLVNGGAEAIATATGLPITGATAKAVAFPSAAPSAEMTISPQPTPVATKAPTKAPTKSPTKNPTMSPTKNPTKNPTKSPTKNPTKNPTKATESPTKSPVKAPKATENPTKSPVKAPTPAPPTTSAGVSGYGSVGVSAVLASVSAVAFLVLN